MTAVMINGFGCAQNNWQPSPPPGLNNNKFWICLSPQLLIIDVELLRGGGQTSLSPLSDGIKLNKLFSIS